MQVSNPLKYEYVNTLQISLKPDKNNGHLARISDFKERSEKIVRKNKSCQPKRQAPAAHCAQSCGVPANCTQRDHVQQQ